MTAVWSLDLPDSEKIVLLALADCANDEGHCWPSIRTLTVKCSKTDRTIQASIKRLVDGGHLTRREVMGKGCNYTVHPRSNFTPEVTSPPKPAPPTPEAASDKPSRTIIPKKDKPSLVRAHELPDDWEPSVFGEATQSRKVVDGWPPGEAARQLEHFRAHHRKKGDRFKSWQDAWATWVLNARAFGGHNGRSDTLGRNQPADGLSSTARAAIAVFGSDPGDGRGVPQ